MRALSTLALVALISSGSAALAQSPAAQSPASSKPLGAPGVTAVGAILVNLSDDDQILFQRSARAQRAPASLTKYVTALVALDEYGMDEVVTANSLVLQPGGSDLGLEPGMQITVRELLYALLLKSANDAGMALAAHDRQGYEHFIQLMNQKARSLGAYDSQFRNPHGLDMVGHYSSARDMAIFAREVFRDPILAAISGSREHAMTWKGRYRNYDHHHKLLLRKPSVISGKTGFTNNAGHCLITAANTTAGTLLAVVLGSADQYGDTESMFEYGKSASSRLASGGGSVEGYGQLAAPPAAPDEDLAASAPGRSDPRDDLRWSILMMVLAAVTAWTLLTNRRRAATKGSDVHRWLAELQTDERRKRP